MRTALVVHHVDFEDLGSFGPILQSAGYSILQHASGSGPIDAMAHDLLVVLGGPMGVYEADTHPGLIDEIEAVRQRLAADAPTLGLCLGAQIMAAALGARVYPGKAGKEIGWGTVSLTPAGLEGPLSALAGVPVLHWHGDTFDLPLGAVLLASSDRYRHQAFSFGRNGLALQFHPEVEAVGLEDWFVGHAAEIAETPGVSVPILRADTAANAPALRGAAEAFLTGWLAQISEAKRIPS